MLRIRKVSGDNMGNQWMEGPWEEVTGIYVETNINHAIRKIASLFNIEYPNATMLTYDDYKKGSRLDAQEFETIWQGLVEQGLVRKRCVKRDRCGNIIQVSTL